MAERRYINGRRVADVKRTGSDQDPVRVIFKKYEEAPDVLFENLDAYLSAVQREFVKDGKVYVTKQGA